MLRTVLLFVSILLLAALALRCKSDDGKPRVLIFNKSEFYVHECMPAAVEALQKICADKGWHADVTEDNYEFTEENLSRYAAVVFLNTAGDVLNPTQEIEFERYIQAGGGFVGVHTAIDTEHNWPWYGKLVGGRFDGLTEVQPATVQVADTEHAATKHLEPTWQHSDEWFNLTSLSPDLHVLLNLDESTCSGGKMGPSHPVAWYHEYDGGRVFFTAMGHPVAAYAEPAFLQHLAGGLQYAVGVAKPVQFQKHRPMAQTASGTGFVKTSVVCDLNEPMGMGQLPDGKILFIERRGAMKLYDPASSSARTVAEFEVYHQNEEGLIGMAIDPKWAENHWIYLYYSPEGKTGAIRLARFVFQNDSLYRGTELVLFEVPTDRSVHNYHAGGGLRFDASGILYIATGDNTDHYDDGYASTDERVDKSQYDSQKSASNSMDLRGKILRIKPLPDGSYLCPAGNLFAEKEIRVLPGGQHLVTDPSLEGIAYPTRGPRPVSIAADYLQRANVWWGRGRPEIFVMGCRNPFRLDFDNRRGLLIWGEPGPDAGVPDSTRGPEGYDEINLARTAGFYGWPYCVGPNLPYREYNFETGTPGPWFDPMRPYNDSPHNTGDRQLPPARKPTIWYPFKSSKEFPLVANGTRCAMTGPAYYCDQYPPETRFPDRFDGKIIIYEWMRNWMNAVGIDSLDQYTDMQPLAPNVRLARPIDMFIDKKGSLWVLEYGTEWYAQNPDACLSRIDYVRGDGATDDEVVETAAGNATPVVHWDFGGKNRSFYQPGDVVRYAVQVADTEDGTLADGRISTSDVLFQVGYLESGESLYRFIRHIKPKPQPFERGKKLVDGSDCRSCHAVDRKINGPAYRDIARRYQDDKAAPKRLAEKIIKGGKGVWGEVAMSAHPQLAPKDVADMVRWILAVGELETPTLQGTHTLKPPAGKEPGNFIFHAAYCDRGGPGQKDARTGSETIALRPAQQQAERADSVSRGAATYKRPLNNTTTTVVELKHTGCLVFKGIDLRSITSISLALDVSAARKHTGGGKIELRLGGPAGKLAGTASIPPTSDAGGLVAAEMKPDRSAWPADGALQDLFFVIKNEAAGEKAVVGVDWLRVEW
ncbi:MAG: ThuA domain-containing protein [Saprospiraceae bacterium]